MEGLTRLVTESLVRHGFDRPLDYRRLHWSRWFRCESPHSLLVVPSKAGVFAVAEEITNSGDDHVQRAALGCPAEQSSAAFAWERGDAYSEPSLGDPATPTAGRLAVADSVTAPRRMLAVVQFFDADDMAFTLDRMLTRQNPMRPLLTSGSYFVRFVSIEDESQRRSICNALNQWVVSSSEKASGIGAHFAASLEVLVARTRSSASASSATVAARAQQSTVKAPSPQVDSGAATNLHCPSPFPSGF